MKALSVLRSVCLFVGIMTMYIGAQAQSLTVDTAMDPNTMVSNIVGPGVQVSNVVVTAAPNSYGYYYSQGTEMGNNEGILLTTGRAVNAIGPNNNTGLPLIGPGPNFPCLNCSLYDNNFAGSALLNLAQNRTTRDATQIEFDIKPQGDSLKFSYTFGSEEYLEWVGSPYNDVFGFYISGPGIGTDVNIALIPNTSQSVAINNVNNTTNTQYFYNNQNPFGQYVQYDGLTVGLKALVGNLIPCETYHLKLVIADGSDRIYDSGVFINKIESNPVVVITATTAGIDYMIEGCNDGVISFTREIATPSAQTVSYWIGGTATNGVDYQQIGTGVPLALNNIIIPANATSVELPITTILDGIPEGQEYITIYLDNPLCSDVQVLDSINFYINDFFTVDAQPDAIGICFGQCATLNAVVDGSGASFTWEPTTGLDNPLAQSVQACPDVTTTYVVTARIEDCVATDSVTVSVSNITLDVSSTDVTCTNGSTGTLSASVNGAVEPISYSWTGPDGFTSTEQNPQDVPAGTYCLSVVDANGCVADTCVDVIEQNVLTLVSGVLSSYSCYAISCNGACDGTINITISGGSAPYTYAWSNGEITQDVSNLCAGIYTVVITDANGCELTHDYSISEPEVLNIVLLGSIDVLCNGTATGSISVDANGGCGPYTYDWSHDPTLTGPTASNLTSGNYTVDVQDVNGCSSNGSLNITVNPPINPLVVTVDAVSDYNGFGVSCPDATDGFVSITASAGTLPYTFSWFSLGTGTVVSTSEDLIAAECGSYIVTVTDANGCEITQSFNLPCVPDLNVVFTSSPNPCGSGEAGAGSINITSINGGHGGPFTVAYNGPDCAPCLVEDLLNANSGSYDITVTDAQGCEVTLTATIGTNSDFTMDGTASPVTCNGGTDGNVDITIDPAGSYTYSWTNAAGSIISTSEDLTNVPAGNYCVNVSSVATEATFQSVYTTGANTITVNTNSDPLANPSTFNVDGSTQISVTFAGTHTFVSDLSWHLIGPASCGSPDIILSPNPGNNCNGGNDFGPLVFATGAVDNFYVCSATVPLAGTFGTYGAGATPIDWSLLNGCPVFDNGWSVQVWDCVGSDSGSLSTGNISFSGTDSNGSAISVTLESGALGSPIPASGTGGPASCNSGSAGNSTYSDVPLPSSGLYTVTQTSSPGQGGCEASMCFDVTEPAPVVITLGTAVNPICQGQSNGSIDIDVTGGTGPYTFVWTSAPGCYQAFNATTEDISGVYDCTYTVVATDANGCTGTFTYTLAAPQPMTLSFDYSNYGVDGDGNELNIACNGGNNGWIEIFVAGGTPDCATWAFCYDVSWNGSTPNPSSSGNAPNANILQNLTAGHYVVTVTDANGCVATTFKDLTEPPAITNTSSTVDVTCNGGTDGIIYSVISGGTGTFTTYNWSPSVDPNVASNDTISGLAAGCYVLTVQDNNQCSASYTYCINEPDAVVLTIDNTTPIDCAIGNNATITFHADGGSGIYTYVVDGPGGPYSSSPVTGLGAGTYTITATDENGCSDTQTVTIDPAPSFELSVTSVTQLPGQIYDLKCFGDDNGSLLATPTDPTGTYTYIWTDTLGNFLGGNAQLNGLFAGVYCVEVTNATGCTATACDTITQPDVALTATYTVGTYFDAYNISCFNACDGNINVTVDGGVPGYTYLWNDGNTLSADPVQTDLCAGTYAILVTDSNGCDVTLFVDLIQPDPIVVDATLSQYGAYNISCNNSCDGTIDIINSGGSGTGYVVEWTSPVLPTGPSQTGLCAGTYNILVTDSYSCTATASFDLVQPAPLTATLGNEIDCTAGTTTMCVVAEGGTDVYTYAWANGQTTPCIIVTTTGSQCVTVTDSNGCPVLACQNAIAITPMNVTLAPTNATCGLNNGAINATATGGTGSYLYNWTGPNVNVTAEDQTGLGDGSFNIVVTDQLSACSVTASTTLTFQEAILNNAQITNLLCNADGTGAIVTTFTNGTAPIASVWTDSNNNVIGNTPSLANLQVGTYTISWTDAAGCTGTTPYTVTQPEGLSLTAVLSLQSNGFNISTYGGSDGAIDISVAGGTTPYGYDWSNLDESIEPQDVANLTTGDYTVTVTDANGCKVDSTFTMTQPTVIELPNGVTPNNDGQNDYYVIRGIDGKMQSDFKVFNRWGNLVYSKTNYDNTWKGQSDGGDDLPNGTYFVVFVTGNKEFNTYVDLRR